MNTVGKKTRQNKTNKQGRKQTEGSGRESSLQRTSSPEMISGGKNQEIKAKQPRATAYSTRRARKATVYIYKQCKTTQIGRQGKDKDNECATQRNKMKEEGRGDSNQIK